MDSIYHVNPAHPPTLSPGRVQKTFPLPGFEKRIGWGEPQNR